METSAAHAVLAAEISNRRPGLLLAGAGLGSLHSERSHFLIIRVHDTAPGSRGQAVMAKVRRAHYDADALNRRAPLIRCAWCGIAAAEQDQATVRRTQLCGECFAILRHVDWKSLIGP